jgi:hypothetical protein
MVGKRNSSSKPAIHHWVCAFGLWLPILASVSAVLPSLYPVDWRFD